MFQNTSKPKKDFQDYSRYFSKFITLFDCTWKKDETSFLKFGLQTKAVLVFHTSRIQELEGLVVKALGHAVPKYNEKLVKLSLRNIR